MKISLHKYFWVGLFSLIYILGLAFITYSLSHGTNTIRTFASDENISRYVSPEGNDNYDGLSPTFQGGTNGPWKTVQKAANSVIAGQIVYVRGGVYQEQVYIQNSGTTDAHIKFLAYPGETPIIDGNNQIPSAQGGALFTIAGNYVEAFGFEVRNSNWMGVVLVGQHNKVGNFNSHHNMENGILIMGNYGIVENSKVWSNAMSNINGSRTRNFWASGLSAARSPQGAIMRHNQVYDNWGEGLSTYEASGTILEDNIVYDNFSANIYISDATNILCQRNLVYDTNTFMNVGDRAGIVMGDETYNPTSRDITVINNLVINTHRAYYWWQGVNGGGMNNVLVANNTFVNSFADNTVQISGGSHQNVRFENNIIKQDNSLPVALVVSSPGLSFSKNLWSKNPSTSASGSGDIISNPKLAGIGSTASGQLNGDWFKLLPDSPAINRAIVIPEVNLDYFNQTRDSQPDIGGVELNYSGPTNTPSPSIITPTPQPPTSTPLPTHIIIPTSIPTSIPTPTFQKPIHVQSIKLNLIRSSSTRTYAQAVVVIVDSNNNPVRRATVNGVWSQIVSGTSSGYTNSLGNAVLRSKAVSQHGTFVFTVTKISAPGYIYDANQNVLSSASITW